MENCYKLCAFDSVFLREWWICNYIIEAKKIQGEEYKLFWPDEAEFVRMAALFGATIIPVGCVGEDDFLEVPILPHSKHFKQHACYFQLPWMLAIVCKCFLLLTK